MPEELPAVNQHAEDLYVARSVATEASVEPPAVSFADLLRYVTDRSTRLTAAQWKFCQDHPRLSADYRALVDKFALALLPQAAAASQGELQERNFPGGNLRIRPSSVPGQVYLIFTIGSELRACRFLLLEGADGSTARIELPEPDVDGGMLVIQDIAGNEADASAIRLLCNPTTSGVFLP
jgi:hypothetical protein